MAVLVCPTCNAQASADARDFVCACGDLFEVAHRFRPVERALFRIAQEAMFNAARHAAADRAWIELGYGPGVVRLVVADDGKGDAVAVRRLVLAFSEPGAIHAPSAYESFVHRMPDRHRV